MYTIGYNTVRLYLQKDLFRKIKKRIKLKLVPGSGWLYIYNGAEVYFNFSIYGNTYVDFNIPALLYGNSLDVAGVEDISAVVKFFTEVIVENFSSFNISKLSVATNLKSLGDQSVYVCFLRKPPRFRGVEIESNKISFSNSFDKSTSGRVLTFSHEGDVVRVETFLTSNGNVKAKQLIRDYLSHDSKVSELLKESFYIHSAEYFESLVKSAIDVKEPVNASIVEQTLKNLQDNYVNSFEPKYSLRPF